MKEQSALNLLDKAFRELNGLSSQRGRDPVIRIAAALAIMLVSNIMLRPHCFYWLPSISRADKVHLDVSAVKTGSVAAYFDVCIEVTSDIPSNDVLIESETDSETAAKAGTNRRPGLSSERH